jgi:hypothetical protein
MPSQCFNDPADVALVVESINAEILGLVGPRALPTLAMAVDEQAEYYEWERHRDTDVLSTALERSTGL